MNSEEQENGTLQHRALQIICKIVVVRLFFYFLLCRLESRYLNSIIIPHLFGININNNLGQSYIYEIYATKTTKHYIPFVENKKKCANRSAYLYILYI